ncbi:MAG: FRG domain-containing protein [Bacillota bacterium]
MTFSAEWKDILDEVDNFTRLNSGIVWFRGISISSEELNSGLFRLNISDQSSDYINLEKQMYSYFKNLGHLLLSNEEGWKLLYSMQHHGVRTRLLDWSESFAVGLFFASKDWNKGSACIWMLNPIKLNNLSMSKSEIISPTKTDYWRMFANEGQNSIAIFPIKNNLRISSQHGVFTVQGNSLKPLEKEFADTLQNSDGLKKIELSMNVREDAFNFLRLNGINYFSLFPDLDGLAKYINLTHINTSWFR